MDIVLPDMGDENTFKGVTCPNLGNHLILDFVGVDPSVNLDDMEFLDTHLREIISYTSATIEGVQKKKFEPIGVTMVYLLSESHLSIHTWPENNSCAIDFYHCGDTSRENLKVVEEKLCDLFGWDKCTSNVFLKRGISS